MYYSIRKEKINELAEGKTNTYIAKKTKYSRQYITYIFNNDLKINIKAVINIIRPLADESIKLNKMLKEKGLEYMINYFFKEEE